MKLFVRNTIPNILVQTLFLCDNSNGRYRQVSWRYLISICPENAQKSIHPTSGFVFSRFGTTKPIFQKIPLPDVYPSYGRPTAYVVQINFT